MVGGWFVVARSPLTKRLVLPRLEAMTGARVEADRVRLTLDGRVVVWGLRLGPEGAKLTTPQTVLEVNRADVDLSIGGLLSGGRPVERVELRAPVVRLSQDTRTGRLNVADLKLVGGFEGGEGLPDLPTVATAGGVLEIGEHGADGYAVVQRFPVTASLTPATEVEGYVFRLRQPAMPQSEGATPIDLRGTYTVDGLDAVLDGVALDDWPADLLPTRVREFYAELGLVGGIERTTLRLSPEGELSASVEVREVGVTLPVALIGSEAGGGVRFERTTGRVLLTPTGVRTSGLTGELEGVRYTVDFDYQGLEGSSPFESRLRAELPLENAGRLLVLAPEGVRLEVEDKLAMFGWPSGTLRVESRVVRGAPGANAPSDVEMFATFELEGVSAAYRGFPYPIQDLKALFTVDTRADRAELVRLRGTNPNGAVLEATGWFAPLGPESAVEIRVTATGLPVDEVLRGTLGDKNRRLVDQLFSEERYRELLDDGLVLPADRAESLRDELGRVEEQIAAWSASTGSAARTELDRLRARAASLRASLDVPAFAFGGSARADVVVRREYGEISIWTRSIRATIAEAGLVPEQFPLPLRAEGLVLDLDGETARLHGGTYEGLTGGEAWVEARAAMGGDGSEGTVPVIEIGAEGVPIDARLLHAIPGFRKGGMSDAGSLRRVLTRLGLSGALSCEAQVGPTERGELGYNVEVVLDGVASSPLASPHADETLGELRIDGITGTVIARHDLIVVDVAGRVFGGAVSAEAGAEAELLTQIEPRGVVFGPLAGLPLLYARATFEGVELRMPFEHAASVFSEGSAEQLAQLRERFAPSGRVRGTTVLSGPMGGVPTGMLRLRGTEDLSFRAGTGRVAFAGASEGQVVVSNLPRGVVRFDRFGADLRAADGPAGRLEVNGSIPVRIGEAPEYGPAVSGTLSAKLTQGRFESDLTRAMVGLGTGGTTPGWYDDARPVGVFDAVLTVEGEADEDGERDFAVSGEVLPRSIALTSGRKRLGFAHTSGRVGIAPGVVTLEGIIAQADAWRVSLDGTVRTGEEGALDADLVGGLEARSLAPSLFEALPEGVRDALTGIELEAERVSVQGARVAVSRAPGAERTMWSLSGAADVSGGSASVAIPLTEIEAVAQIDARDIGEGPEFVIGLNAERMRAAGVRLRGASAQLRGRAGVRLIDIADVAASCHGGRLAGSGQILTGPEPSPFWFELQAAGVRAAPLFDDMGSAAKGGLGGVPATADAVEAATGDELWDRSEEEGRGVVDANLSVTGSIGVMEDLLGRGEVRVVGGRVFELPGLLNLIELSNLMLPVGAKLGLGRASFFVEGPVVTFEEISASSSQVELYGYGLVTLPDGQLDLRINSRAQRKIPILSPIFEGIRDQLLSTRIGGTISDPDVTTESLGGSRRSLVEISEEQQRRLREAERRVRSGQSRMRSEAQRAVERSSTPATPRSDG